MLLQYLNACQKLSKRPLAAWEEAHYSDHHKEFTASSLAKTSDEYEQSVQKAFDVMSDKGRVSQSSSLPLRTTLRIMSVCARRSTSAETRRQ